MSSSLQERFLRHAGRRAAGFAATIFAAIVTAVPAVAETAAAGTVQAAGGGAAAVPRHTVPDTLAERVQACTVCHGKEGVATNEGYFPRIAGKPAGYLFNQLINFREGRRSQQIMAGMVSTLSDAYLMEIADYFAALDLPYPPPPASARVSPAELEHGRRLALQGDAARRLPACTACHGEALTGLAPAIPGLLGLPRDYLLSQFGAWRNGQRRAAAPDCMHEIGRRMSPEDLSAVATYLAQLPVPANAKPAAADGRPLPMRCGVVTP